MKRGPTHPESTEQTNRDPSPPSPCSRGAVHVSVCKQASSWLLFGQTPKRGHHGPDGQVSSRDTQETTDCYAGRSGGAAKTGRGRVTILGTKEKPRQLRGNVGRTLLTSPRT